MAKAQTINQTTPDPVATTTTACDQCGHQGTDRRGRTLHTASCPELKEFWAQMRADQRIAERDRRYPN